MSSTISEKDVRQLMKEAQKVADGDAAIILITKNTRGKGLFIKAAEITFNLETLVRQ